MGIPLQSGIVYGPLGSRRFGKSLGINLLPTGRKVCLFDCVYCQYGETSPDTGGPFPSVGDIETAVRDAFTGILSRGDKIDCITLAGNGEPTLHPHFGQIVDRLLGLRDEFMPHVPIGILSNSTTCHQTIVQDSLIKLDGCYMKLDAGAARIMKIVNQPLVKQNWSQMMSGLYHLRKFYVQSLFVCGRADNTQPEDIEDWVQAVGYVRPISVQIYSIDRPTRDEGIFPAPRARLEEISGILTAKTGIPAQVF